MNEKGFATICKNGVGKWVTADIAYKIISKCRELYGNEDDFGIVRDFKVEHEQAYCLVPRDLILWIEV